MNLISRNFNAFVDVESTDISHTTFQDVDNNFFMVETIDFYSLKEGFSKEGRKCNNSIEVELLDRFQM